MANLKTLQIQFLKSLNGDTSFMEAIKFSPENRLSVYHGSVRETLRKALHLTYPLTWKLIGEDCANGAAYAFIREEKWLPQTGNLDDWGEEFSTFLKNFPPTQSLSYLSDFARLEWLSHLAYGAPDKPPLTHQSLQSLQKLPNEAYEKLSLELHPSTHLLSSAYPLDQILAVVKEEISSTILEQRGAYALLARPYKSVEIHWISKPFFVLFSQFEEGCPLLDALNALEDDTFELSSFLSFAFQQELISGYTVAI